MEIIKTLVHNYIAVGVALTAAGHDVDGPKIDRPGEPSGEIFLPDVWSDEHGNSGLALKWDLRSG